MQIVIGFRLRTTFVSRLRLGLRCEGVHNQNAVDRGTVLHILTQDLCASGSSGALDDQRVPK